MPDDELIEIPNPNALHEAAWVNDLSKVIQLLEKGADCNQPHTIHNTFPIDWAAQGGGLDVLHYFFSKKERAVKTENLVKCAVWGGNVKIIEYLYQSHKDLMSAYHFTARVWAICIGDTALFLQQKAHHMRPMELSRLMAVALRFDTEKMLPFLIENEVFNLNSIVEDNKTIAWYLGLHHRWELLSKLANQAAYPLELNTCPLNDSDPNKGLTLAYLMALNKQPELLNKNASQVNFNAGPLSDKHGDLGLTVAYAMVIHEYYDQLTECSKKKPVNVNLNVRCLAKNTMPLALYLGIKLKWDLLSALTTDNLYPVNLNYRVLQPGRYRGLTLPYLLFINNQRDLYIQLKKQNPEPINPNLMIEAESSSKGTTFAWLLAEKKESELLEEIIAEYPEETDFTVSPKIAPGKTLRFLWVTYLNATEIHRLVLSNPTIEAFSSAVKESQDLINRQDIKGKTALHYAVNRFTREKNQKGKNHIAAMIQVLIAHGASRTIADERNLTVLGETKRCKELAQQFKTDLEIEMDKVLMDSESLALINHIIHHPSQYKGRIVIDNKSSLLLKELTRCLECIVNQYEENAPLYQEKYTLKAKKLLTKCHDKRYQDGKEPTVGLNPAAVQSLILLFYGLTKIQRAITTNLFDFSRAIDTPIKVQYLSETQRKEIPAQRKITDFFEKRKKRTAHQMENWDEIAQGDEKKRCY
ncbi:MAG: hypothetical protein WC785_00725 [Tatlockia sp.]